MSLLPLLLLSMSTPELVATPLLRAVRRGDGSRSTSIVSTAGNNLDGRSGFERDFRGGSSTGWGQGLPKSGYSPSKLRGSSSSSCTTTFGALDFDDGGMFSAPRFELEPFGGIVRFDQAGGGSLENGLHEADWI